MHLQLGELSAVIVSSPEFAKEVMNTHDVGFASRPYNPVAHIVTYNTSDIVFAPYSDYWRQVRKICILELLSTKRVQSFRFLREEEMSNLIGRIASKSGSPINLSSELYLLMNIITSRAVFGKNVEDRDRFLSLFTKVSELTSGFTIADLFPSIEGLLQWITGMKSQLEKMHQDTDGILENIINKHKKGKAITEIGKSQGDQNLVNVLLKIQEDGEGGFHLATNSIKAVILDMFGAGTETSATTVDWAMSELMKNPKVMKEAQAEVRAVFNRNGKVDETGINEMKFLELILKETLRLHPPLPLLVPRECRERCEVKGYVIPVKTKVIINAWAIGRDSKYWSKLSFIPERFLDSPIDYKGVNFEYIPFGAGRRICPGIPFGLANVKFVLAMLLYHFDWKLSNQMKPDDLNMTESSGIAVRRKEELHLVPIPYHPPSAV